MVEAYFLCPALEVRAAGDAILNSKQPRDSGQRNGSANQGQLQLRTATFQFIEVFYNRQRRHSALGNLSPAEYGGGTLNSKQPHDSGQRNRSTEPGLLLLSALAEKPHRLGLELQGVRRVVRSSLHSDTFLPEHSSSSSHVSTEAGEDHQGHGVVAILAWGLERPGRITRSSGSCPDVIQ